MKTVYRGLVNPRTGDCQVLKKDRTTNEFVPIEHHVHHSPTGFAWGYGGSGPADLARSLLWDHLGYEPPATLYQEFKFAIIAPLPQDEPWMLDSDDIRRWLDSWEDQNGRKVFLNQEERKDEGLRSDLGGTIGDAH